MGVKPKITIAEFPRSVKIETKQTTLREQFKDIEWCNNVWSLVEDKTITYVAAWLLCGNYKILRELPSVEEDLPVDAKENLAMQRLLARENFRGVVANAPVAMLTWFKGIFVNTTNEFGGMFQC